MAAKQMQESNDELFNGTKKAPSGRRRVAGREVFPGNCSSCNRSISFRRRRKS
jgi:mono/diheme cytochrome c family protein